MLRTKEEIKTKITELESKIDEMGKSQPEINLLFDRRHALLWVLGIVKWDGALGPEANKEVLGWNGGPCNWKKEGKMKSNSYLKGYEETEQAIQAARARDLEKQYLRLVAQRRRRHFWGPMILGAIVAVIVFWLIRG